MAVLGYAAKIVGWVSAAQTASVLQLGRSARNPTLLSRAVPRDGVGLRAGRRAAITSAAVPALTQPTQLRRGGAAAPFDSPRIRRSAGCAGGPGRSALAFSRCQDAGS